MKTCSTCGTEKPLDQFGTDRSRKDGLCYYCKECGKVRTAKRKVHKAAYDKARVLAPEQKLRKAEREVAYYLANRSRIRLTQAAYYAGNGDAIRGLRALRRAEHPRIYAPTPRPPMPPMEWPKWEKPERKTMKWDLGSVDHETARERAIGAIDLWTGFK